MSAERAVERMFVTVATSDPLLAYLISERVQYRDRGFPFDIRLGRGFSRNLVSLPS